MKSMTSLRQTFAQFKNSQKSCLLSCTIHTHQLLRSEFLFNISSRVERHTFA